MTETVHPNARLERDALESTPVQAVPLGQPATASRLVVIDHAKAIGIALVVLGHVWRGMVNSGIVNTGDGYGWLDDWIYAFHMPLFFLIAGLFIDRAVVRPWASVVRSKAATLLYPYLIWSSLQVMIGSGFSGYTNRGFAVSELPRILLLHPLSPFWFLYVLFAMELLFVAARKLAVPPGVLALMGAALLWWADDFSWVPAMYFGKMFVYFAVGALGSSLVSRWVASNATMPALLAAVGGGALLTLLTVHVDVSQPEAGFAAAVCGIVMVLGLSTALASVSWAKVLGVLGSLSLYVYVMHVLLASGARVALYRFAQVETAWVHVLVGTLVGLIGPVLFVMVTRPVGGEWLFRVPMRTSNEKKRSV